MTAPTSCAAPEQALLPELLDGALDEATARRGSDHAATCAHCGPELGDLREFDAAMRAAHLSSDEVVEAAWGDASAADPHLLLCSPCRDEVAAVRAARLDVGAAASPATPRSGFRLVPLALAAMVVIGIGLALQRGLAGFGPASDPAESSTTRGEALPIDGLAPQGEVSRGLSELLFAWRGSGTGRYALLFFTEDGRPLARIEVEGTRHVLSPDDRSKLESQTVFFWKVESLGGMSVGPDSALVRVSWAP